MQSHVYMNYAEQSNFTKSKSRFKNILAIILKQILNLVFTDDRARSSVVIDVGHQ